MNALNQAAAGVGFQMPAQGTILPGTTIQLGKYTVVIDRYIAEGGFAHVYLASLQGFPVVVKRIAAPDKERLAIVNSEIETMKRLGKHKNIVEYMDSCMGKLEGGGYEVLILMENCAGGPVIDLMNRRLQHRLTEPEILKIFSNVCEAVAYMHYSDPPILHRDIKVENILLSQNDYKLCDFGSATTNILKGDKIPKNVKDIQLLEEEINNHTTLQYRAPEMLDLYMKKGIDEKIDIWALGVLLYKLCFYTTPFEEQGQLAILNARYTIPDNPVFSPGLINLIKTMLKEDPRQRPNIYQLMKMTSALRRLPCPIHNIYPEVTESFAPTEPLASATANIFSSAVMTRPMDILPSIEPMRRGRPTRSPANSTPGAGSTPTPTVDATQSAFSSAFPPLSDINSGFDDSFGQFTELADPAAKFTQVSSAGDAFDFGSPSSSNHGGIKDSTSKQRSEKRFTLDFETGRPNNEFGFNFATGSSSPADSKDSAAAKPRPPSFDLLRPETQLRPGSSNSVPKQPSGASGGLNSFMSKPTANDLFFGTSSELKPDQSSVTNNHARSITPQQVAASQSSGAPKPLLGSRQPSQQSANSESSGTMPSSTLQGYHPSTSVLNRNMYSNGTGNSRAGSSAASSVASPNPGHRPTGSIGSANSHFNSGSDSSPSTKMENLALLQRQQIEQLGRFSSESTTGSPLNQQTPQGSTRPLDSSKTLDSKTLDGLKAQDLSSRVESFVAGQSAVYSGVNSGTNGDAKGRDRKSMGYKEAIQQDMEAELKLIQAQQKEFERQQQELFRQQRQELEEQQRQHRVQQEQLQKQQQQQIQIQHEKWQERKRLLKDQEREQLMQNQDQQRKELEQRHLNQQQQLQQNGQLPEVSDLAASIASVSLNSQPAQGSVAAMSALYSGNSGGIKSPTYPPSSTPLAGFSMPTGGSTSSARASLDDPGLRSQTNLTGLSVDSHSSASAPFVPVKSARRTGAGIGASGATPVPGAASSTINATAANVYKARRASVNNLPPGQKPELMPKPTRFRMKDGTGLLHSGEEEAFRRKFPSSADFEADLIQFGASSESSSQQHTSSVPSTRGKEPGTGESGQWKEQPAATTANTTNLAYRSPSQRVRDLQRVPGLDCEADEDDGERLSRSSAARREYGWQDVGGEYSHGNEHEEEEEEETLVRSRPANRHRHQDSNVSITGLGPQQTGEEPVLIDASDAATPLESVRERVLRMNRVGRIA